MFIVAADTRVSPETGGEKFTASRGPQPACSEAA
jgi:hypothetical protein